MSDYWNDCIDHLRQHLPQVQFTRWIEPSNWCMPGRTV